MRSFLIAISGPTAAGKTYFTKRLVERIEATGMKTVRISTDEFYKDLSHLTMEERIKVNYDLPESIDIDEFFGTMEDLSSGKSVTIPVYDFTTHTRTQETRTVEPANLIILEGIFSLSFKQINPLYDLRIFIDLDQDLRLIRRIKRDMQERGRNLESVFNQYISQVRPAQQKFVRNDRDKADLILLGNNNHETIIDLLQTAIKAKTQNK